MRLLRGPHSGWGSARSPTGTRSLARSRAGVCSGVSIWSVTGRHGSRSPTPMPSGLRPCCAGGNPGRDHRSVLERAQDPPTARVPTRACRDPAHRARRPVRRFRAARWRRHQDARRRVVNRRGPCRVEHGVSRDIVTLPGRAERGRRRPRFERAPISTNVTAAPSAEPAGGASRLGRQSTGLGSHS